MWFRVILMRKTFYCAHYHYPETYFCQDYCLYMRSSKLRSFSHDVTHPYLQSDEKLTRKICPRPNKEDCKFFTCHEGKKVKNLLLVRPLYGLTNSGDYCGNTYNVHVKKIHERNQLRETHLYSSKEKLMISAVF